MKKTFATLILAVAFIANSAVATNPAKDGFYAVDNNASTVTWTGTKITGSTQSGTVAFKSGGFSIADGAIQSGKFAIDMTSITCSDLTGEMKGKLEGHLKSEDFFAVEKHNTALLVVTSSKVVGDHIEVTADLTIKGITNSVTFDLTMTEENGAFTVTANVTFDRSKFDIRYGSDSFFDNLGDKAINNEVTFAVSLSGKAR